MKKHLIYYSHIDTTTRLDAIHVQLVNSLNDSQKPAATCRLDRISRDSFTLSCDQTNLNKLMANKASIAPKSNLTLESSFMLGEQVNATCQVIFSRRHSKDVFVLELKFHNLNDHNMHLIDTFVERCQEDNRKLKETNAEHKQIKQPETMPVNAQHFANFQNQPLSSAKAKEAQGSLYSKVA